jgi:uncharacterized protein YneF (UPF0154 family)
MAEVIVEQASGVNAGGLLTGLLSPISFLLHNWYVLILGVILAIAIGIILYFISSTKDLKRERDEAGYFLYKKTVKDCVNGRDKKKYKKTYSFLKNIFWFGIPILKKDESKFIFNKNGDKLGRYRGHVVSQDGTYNILVCTGSILGFMDTNILIKVPMRIKTKEKGSKEFVITQFDLIKEDYLDKSITISCIGLERTALFYYMPIFSMRQKDGSEQIVDLREHMESSVADSTYQVMLQRILSTGQKQMEKAMTFNPHLKYEQMSPEKTLPEQEVDK